MPSDIDASPADRDTPPVRRQLSKRTLATVSFAIERFALELATTDPQCQVALIGAFQHRPYFLQRRAEYDRLARAGVDVVTAYAGPPSNGQLAAHIELDVDDVHTERWDAVLISDDLCAFVTAVDRHDLADATVGLEPARLFAAEIGVDPVRAADLLDEWTALAGDQLPPELAARLQGLAARRRSAPTSTTSRVWGSGFMLLCDRLEATLAEWRHEADLAIRDQLTGVLNRHGVRRWMGGDDELPIPAIGVVMIDLDGFKQVNDTHGHAVGDAVLVAVASALSASVRQGDLVVRWGGDEFVALCPGLQDQDELDALVGRFAHALSTVEVHGVTPRASFGTQVARSRPLVLDSADAAMYAAKRAKPDRISR